MGEAHIHRQNGDQYKSELHLSQTLQCQHRHRQHSARTSATLQRLQKELSEHAVSAAAADACKAHLRARLTSALALVGLSVWWS